MGIECLLIKTKWKMSQMIIDKSQNLPCSIPLCLTQGIMLKNSDSLIEQKKMFECKICLKSFADGRQLGGHISRAHTKQKRIKKG